MRLKRSDIVRLKPTWAKPQDPKVQENHPIWGGIQGYKMGMVTQVKTHDHNPENHKVIVEWTSVGVGAQKFEGEYPEEALAVVTKDERDIALDALNPEGPVDRDIWVLLRTTAGNFALNVVECLPFGRKNPDCRYIVSHTRNVIDNIHNIDTRLIDMMLSMPDYTEQRLNNLFVAMSKIYENWGLPLFDHLPLPLPEYQTITHAAQHAPKGPSVLFFHLPKNLVDYSEEPPTKT